LIILKLTAAKDALGSGSLLLLHWHVSGDARLLTLFKRVALEVAAISYYRKLLNSQRCFRLLGYLGQLPLIGARIGYLHSNYQFVLAVHGRLQVVANIRPFTHAHQACIRIS